MSAVKKAHNTDTLQKSANSVKNKRGKTFNKASSLTDCLYAIREGSTLLLTTWFMHFQNFRF